MKKLFIISILVVGSINALGSAFDSLSADVAAKAESRLAVINNI